MSFGKMISCVSGSGIYSVQLYPVNLRSGIAKIITYKVCSDMAGGSTLGNISNTQVAVDTVDIGLPQLAMHSPYETAGVYDTDYFIKAAAEFFS